jgi:hypothetical protein
VGGVRGFNKEIDQHETASVDTRIVQKDDQVLKSLRKDIELSVKVVLQNIGETKDIRVLKRIDEEMKLLNTFCEYEKIDSISESILNKDVKMRKKQKTQRSYMSKKT